MCIRRNKRTNVGFVLFVQCVTGHWIGVVCALVVLQLFHTKSVVPSIGGHFVARSVVDSKLDAARFNQPQKERPPIVEH